MLLYLRQLYCLVSNIKLQVKGSFSQKRRCYTFLDRKYQMKTILLPISKEFDG